MMTLRWTGPVGLVLLLSIAGCGGSTRTAEAQRAPSTEIQTTTPEPKSISYSRDVAPLFADHGCVNCHHTENAVKVDLTRPFDPELGIVNRPNSWTRSEKKILVVPGNPDASALILKVSRTDLELKVDGDPMPWNIPPLSDQQAAQLRAWIESGAKNDASFPAVARIFGDGVSLGSRGGKCAYCHWAGADYGPDLTRVFDPVVGVVGVKADRGGVRVIPGDPDNSVLYLRSSGGPVPPNLQPPMPKHFSRLTAQEVELLRQWIREGARNN